MIYDNNSYSGCTVCTERDRLHSFLQISLCTRTISVTTSPLSTSTSCWPVSSGRRWRRRSKVGPSLNQGSELRGASKEPTRPFTHRHVVHDSDTGRTSLRPLTDSLIWLSESQVQSSFSCFDTEHWCFQSDLLLTTRITSLFTMSQ